MNRFTNKTVLVTGGSSGIGLAAAVAFAAEGATVVITGRDVVTLGQAQATIGSKAVALHNDASDIADAKLLAESLIARGLRLDAVFINAGVAKLVPFAEVDEMLWNRGCAEFCVNGQSTAGASRPVRKHNEHQETRRTRRTAVWPA
ncbi:MAG: SDR family NAD(P)-dependent oxidoreductase, partial [Comamonas sp.]|uniref:SDR family NAD(P)-dependent oxidoreductase n=1 Tax=Comamonas sp. TaxID=34028 RepID=UPI00283FEFA0